MDTITNFFRAHPEPGLVSLLVRLLEIWHSQDHDLRAQSDLELRAQSEAIITQLEAVFGLTLDDIKLISACDDDFRRYLASYQPTVNHLQESA